MEKKSPTLSVAQGQTIARALTKHKLGGHSGFHLLVFPQCLAQSPKEAPPTYLGLVWVSISDLGQSARCTWMDLLSLEMGLRELMPPLLGEIGPLGR